MNHPLAIDFGTTNTVIARWDDKADRPVTLTLPGLSVGAPNDPAASVPSLVYVQDGQAGRAVTGQAVRDGALDRRRDNRLFRNFKRGIAATPAPDPRLIDGVRWTDRDAGRAFLGSLLDAMPDAMADVDPLVLTAPVVAFENYLVWLSDAMGGIAPEKIRIVDESTAAALGYAVTEPNAAVLVFDGGGGTLDVSLVQLPENREKTGGFLDRLRRTAHKQPTARVIAKAGRVLGGSDMDRWLLAEVLRRAGLTLDDLGGGEAMLLTMCEQAKIALSTVEATPVSFEVNGAAHEVCVTRAELEALLEHNGFYAALRHLIDGVLHVAQRRGIFREDIAAVLLVGGVTLMPSVRRLLGQTFGDMTVRADKPFTAVAEGALQLALGFGLDDYLAHSYGLRHLDPETGRHAYEEIIPMGNRCPTDRPFEIILSAAHDGQREIEFVVGEIAADDVSAIDVKYEDGQAVFVAKSDQDNRRIQPLNEAGAARVLARLDPPGVPGEDRLKAAFRVDDQRRLRITVIDLKTRRELLRDAVMATLR